MKKDHAGSGSEVVSCTPSREQHIKCFTINDNSEKFGNDDDKKKSAIVVFRNSFVKNTDFPSFQMNGESIKEVPYVKYLGHFICASMKDDMDILRQCRQGNVLACRFHMCADDVKLTLFRSYCSSLYTAQTWWKYTVLSLYTAQTWWKYTVLSLYTAQTWWK